MVAKQGTGRGFPRDAEFGFNRDSGDHKRDQMGDAGKGIMDLVILNGPNEMGWIVDPDFSISASRLTPQHARSAFVHYYKRRKSSQMHASYARRLGSRLRDLNNREFSDEFAELCKLTRKTYYSGGDAKLNGIIGAHLESLAYLGELSIQVQRALVNGVCLHGFVQDVRTTTPWDLQEMLDKWAIPVSNQPNHYNHPFPSLNSTIQSMWLRQDDPQAAEITEKLQTGNANLHGRSH
jgi:hypothetical protein